MRTALLLLVAFLGATVAVPTQGRKAFEVVAVRPAKAASYAYSYPPGGGFKGTLPVEWLIGIAYEIQPLDRIVGEPGWAKSNFFEIDARSATEGTRADTLAMLRTLLEERFGLVWRKDPGGKARVYVLKMARNDRRLGPGIRRVAMDCIKPTGSRPAPVSERQLRPGRPVPCGIGSDGVGLVAGGNQPIGSLMLPLRLALGQEVIDRTELTGNFDYYVHLPRHQLNVVKEGAGNRSVFSAVQEELGMKLEQEEISWDLFVVERVSQPQPN